jgi:protein TonB
VLPESGRAGFGASLMFHALALAAIALASQRSLPSATKSLAATGTPPSLVWLLDPGPGGGGKGGGGNEHPEPAQRAQSPGREAYTLSPARLPSVTSTADVEPDQVSRPIVAAVPVASGIVVMPGAIDAVTLSTGSRGPGRGSGAGDRGGSGDGPDGGPGICPGDSPGVGGGPYRPGNGVRAPTEISHGTPRYTADAMRARLQGAVLVECVVETNGRCSRTRVVRGLEPSFGLNEEAVRAAEQWRFRPGTRQGQPVPVLVTLEITFALR